MVYPTLLAAVADVAAPAWRGAAIGVYRLWRDLGFAVGALLAGSSPTGPGCRSPIGAVAALTAASGLVVLVRMRETRVAVRRIGARRRYSLKRSSFQGSASLL